MGDLGDAKRTVQFLSRLGVDGVVALNTQKDYASFKLPPADEALLTHYTSKYGGGLSGPPILEHSTKQAAAREKAVKDLRLGASSLSSTSAACRAPTTCSAAARHRLRAAAVVHGADARPRAARSVEAVCTRVTA